MNFVRHDVTAIILANGDVKSKGVLMSIDIYAKSVQILERIANSVHDRDPKAPNLFCFTISEVHLVESWLEEILRELRET